MVEKCSSCKLKIYTTDLTNNLFVYELIEISIYKNSDKYKELSNDVDKIVGMLKIVTEQNRQKERKDNKNVTVENIKEVKDNSNDLEQLEKLAELKEKGIITEEEFEESKKKILSKL